VAVVESDIAFILIVGVGSNAEGVATCICRLLPETRP